MLVGCETDFKIHPRGINKKGYILYALQQKLGAPFHAICGLSTFQESAIKVLVYTNKPLNIHLYVA